MKSIRCFFVICLVVAIANIAFAKEELTLTWDSNVEQDLLGYKIYQHYISLDGRIDTTTVIYDGIRASYVFTVKEPGDYYYVVTAYNAIGESGFSNEAYYWYDLPPNDSPVSSAGPDRMVSSNTPITLDGSASTDDQGIVSHGWKQVYPPTTTIFSTEEQPTVTLGIGIFSFSNTVTDLEGETDTDMVVIIARP